MKQAHGIEYYQNYQFTTHDNDNDNDNDNKKYTKECSGCFKKFKDTKLYYCPQDYDSINTPLCKTCSLKYAKKCSKCSIKRGRDTCILISPNQCQHSCNGCDKCITECSLCDTKLCTPCIEAPCIEETNFAKNICNFCDKYFCDKHNFLSSKSVMTLDQPPFTMRLYLQYSSVTKVNICKKCSGVIDKEATINNLEKIIYDIRLEPYLIPVLTNIVIKYLIPKEEEIN